MQMHIGGPMNTFAAVTMCNPFVEMWDDVEDVGTECHAELSAAIVAAGKASLDVGDSERSKFLTSCLGMLSARADMSIQEWMTDLGMEGGDKLLDHMRKTLNGAKVMCSVRE
jgi:hypothetical protein